MNRSFTSRLLAGAGMSRVNLPPIQMTGKNLPTPKNEAQRIYFPLLVARLNHGGPVRYRGGTKPRKRVGKVRGPKGFDLSQIKNPDKHLHSHARQMASVRHAMGVVA